MALRINRWTQMTAISDHGDRSSRGGPAHGGVAIVLVLVLVSALAIAASSAEAIGTRNTECVTGTDGFGIINSAAEWAQTFPAKHSGKLLTVELLNYARAPGGVGGDVTVRLYGADESGTPMEPVLASTTIPTADIATDSAYHDYSANFAPETAAYLNAGRTYAIGLQTSDTAQNSWAFNDGDPCAGVELFNRYQSPFVGNSGDDAGLRTYLGPANDDFERAEELHGQNVVIEGTTAGATRQIGEPDHYVTDPPDSDLWVGDHSVWYRWTAPNSGPTTINTCIGEIDSILAVYTGSALNALTRVTDNNNDPACATENEYGSKVSFEAVGGTSYDIAVGDAGGAREKPFGLIIAGAPDTTPPETTIDSGPSGPTTEASPSFTFSSELGASFECRLDSSQGSAFKPCTSPKSYSSLASGPHVFEVRATDESHNTDPTPASRSFTIEAAKSVIELPDSLIRRAKISQRHDSATFRFTSTAPGSTFLCRLDHKPFKACRSPKIYQHLKRGKHRFQVEARDPAGYLDPTPAARAFKIKP